MSYFKSPRQKGGVRKINVNNQIRSGVNSRNRSPSNNSLSNTQNLTGIFQKSHSSIRPKFTISQLKNPQNKKGQISKNNQSKRRTTSR